MKVYVASKFQNYAAVRDAIRYIENAGHEVTHDWTRSEQFDPETGLPRFYNADAPLDVQKHSAAYEIVAVRRSDVMLVLGYPGMANGMVEIGVALGLVKPIAVVNPERCYSIFYTLDGVTTHETIVGALDALGVIEHAPC